MSNPYQEAMADELAQLAYMIASAGIYKSQPRELSKLADTVGYFGRPKVADQIRKFLPVHPVTTPETGGSE